MYGQGSIAGPPDICISGTSQFTVSGSAATSGYNWSVPGTIVSGQGTKTVTVRFNSNGMGQLLRVNGNGLSTTKSVNVYNIPPSPGVISGTSLVCAGGTATFTITPMPPAPAVGNVQWIATNGASILSQSYSHVTVSFPTNYTSGQIMVFGTVITCSPGPTSTKSLSSGGPPPSTPGSISGNSIVAAGQTGVNYSVPYIANATGYQWNLPFGTVITSGVNTNSITVDFSPSFTGGSISVNGTNSMCSGPSSVLYPLTLSSLPGAAGPISVSDIPCIGNGSVIISYSVPQIADATRYAWNFGSLSSGIIPIGNTSLSTVQVQYPSDMTDNNVTFSVSGLNSYGYGPPSSITVNVYRKPAAAGSISGLSSICMGQQNVLYSVAPITNASSYLWNLPQGANIVSGENTNSISISYSNDFVGGQISVCGVNSPCNAGIFSVPLSVAVIPRPIAAGNIVGDALVCPGSMGIVYSVPEITNATGYVWSIPPGASITSGNNTNTITLNFSSTAGVIDVYGTSCSGRSSTSSLAISMQPSPFPAGAITGNELVCPGATGITYSIPPIANATEYIWSVPSAVTIISGQNTNSIIVNFSISTSSGIISVYGNNCQGLGSSSSFAFTMKQLPLAAGTINGKTQICPGETGVTYSILPVVNATGYIWNVPLDATITSGQNTNTIIVDFSTAASIGTISVEPTNCSISGVGSVLSLYFKVAVGSGNVNTSVDLATGIMTAGIPLFTVQDGDILIPGILTYTASGVRVTDDDGWVGHNWSLSANAYRIAREVRGLPDDYTSTIDTRKGWLNSTIATTIKNFTPTNDNNPSTCSDEATNYATLSSMDTNYSKDTEPDVFYLNAPGLSFQFYFDENKRPRALPYQDVIILPNTSTGQNTNGAITFFTVKDQKGVMYTFSEQETITEYVQVPNAYNLVRQTNLFKNPITYTTSWRLSSIVSPVYGTVSFSYREINVNNEGLFPDWYKKTNQYKYRFQIDFKPFNNAPVNIKYSRVSTIKILQKISSPNTDVDFVSVPKYAGTSMERLSTINIYDKREGIPKLTSSVSLLYNVLGTQQRAFLTNVRQSISCMVHDIGMEYYTKSLPLYNSKLKDEWGFYNESPIVESVVAGSLKKITSGYRGYEVFFYEPHDFWNGSSNIQGGGIRVRKMISYDGVSSNGDAVKEYEYKSTSGQFQSSGKLQYKAMHDFEVVCLYSGSVFPGLKYREAMIQGYLPSIFTVQTDEELSHYNMLHGSVVAYERVTVKEKEAGQSIYEFDLPASFGDANANNNEWQASSVAIARPSTGGSTCFDQGLVQSGINKYPFPPNPDYEFARALLKKQTDLREDGTKARELNITYQRVYGNGSSIRKIYGLALEELPTYNYTSSYVNGKMFVYSRYEVFTDVKTEIKTQTETIYNSTDLSQNMQTVKTYFFDSPNHRELARIETQNSDGSTLRSRMKYSKDYAFTTPSGTASVALSNLNSAHRFALVETSSSKITGGTEKYVGADLTLFQTLNGKVYPDKRYSFSSNDGNSGFVLSSVSGGTTFQYNTSYILTQTYFGIDSYGNATTLLDRSRNVTSVAYGYSGTLPVLNASNAMISEIAFSDFETTSPISFAISGFAPIYVTGRTNSNSKALSLPAGSFGTNMLVSPPLSNNKPQLYLFSVWVKSSSAGSFSLKVNNTTTGTNTTFTYAVAASSKYKYYTFQVPLSAAVGTSPMFYINIWSSIDVQIDDLVFYPEYADFVTSTYTIPNGKTSDTDSRGLSRFYENDFWGRPLIIYDQNKNVISKFNYQVRP